MMLIRTETTAPKLDRELTLIPYGRSHRPAIWKKEGSEGKGEKKLERMEIGRE